MPPEDSGPSPSTQALPKGPTAASHTRSSILASGSLENWNWNPRLIERRLGGTWCPHPQPLSSLSCCLRQPRDNSSLYPGITRDLGPVVTLDMVTAALPPGNSASSKNLQKKPLFQVCL